LRIYAWALFIPWLSLLGIIVPPIGAIVIVDPRPGAEIDQQWRAQAFVAWVIGSVVAYIVEKQFPTLSTAVSAFIASAIAYGMIAQMSKSAVAKRA
jgi:cytosine permease